MKKSLAFVIVLACAGVGLRAIAATQNQSGTPRAPTPLPAEQSSGVSTSGRNWTAPMPGSLIPPMVMDRQEVRSWGAATQPGPRNQHVSPPHGQAVIAADRSQVPGRE